MDGKLHGLDRLIAALLDAGIGLDPTHDELADAFWLAARMARKVRTGQTSRQPEPQDGSPESVEQKPPVAESGQQESTYQQTTPSDKDEKEPKLPLFPYRHQRQQTPSVSPERGAPDKGVKAIRVPGVGALPDTLALSRALRPLHRRVPSRVMRVFDEQATVERIADLGFWVPVYRPKEERWLDLALVVDAHSSMLIWEPAILELRRLLERHGAFRDVRVRRLKRDDRGHQAGAVGNQPPHVGLTDERGLYRNPKELRDAAGHRVIWVLSDCVADYWRHNDHLFDLLEYWSAHNPLALVQMLPRRMWSGGGLGESPVIHLRAGTPAPSNSRLMVSAPCLPGILPLPVVTLDPDSLAAWVAMVAARPGAVALGVGLDVRYEPPAAERAADGRLADPETLLAAFRSRCSPQAQRLATLFSTIPLTLPIMRLVQEIQLPESRLTHLAEVFLSGLLGRADRDLEPKVRESDPLRIPLDFLPGIRERLLESLPLSEIKRCSERVTATLEQRFGQANEFFALIANPESRAGARISAREIPFARMRIKVLHRLGGIYKTWAAALERGIADWEDSTKRRLSPIPKQRRTSDVAPSGSPIRDISLKPLEGVMFNAYPDSIGGTLSDTVSMLERPEFKDTFSLFYILPTFFNSDLDRGFSIIDYDLNRELVSWQDLDALDTLGIGLKFDLVLNHLSVGSPQFQDMLKYGDESEYNNFFIDWNEFWHAHGELGPEGYVIPREDCLQMLFMRKPGLPILKVRFPDGTDRPYWNTFYQEVKHQRISPQDLAGIEGIGPDQAEEIAATVNTAIDAKKVPAEIDLGRFADYREDIVSVVERKHSYLGQVDLNARSEGVWDFYDETLKKLRDYGATLIRLDAFAYLHKQPGMVNFFNKPGTWEYLERLKRIADKYGLVLLPEIHSEYGYGLDEEVAGNGFPIYDFFFPGLVIDALDRGKNEHILHWIDDLTIKGFKTVNMLGCHDGIPVLDLKSKDIIGFSNEGLLSNEEIDALTERILNRGGRVKNLYGPDGKKISYYQVNATFFSALGEDEQKLRLARAIQLFMPGIPQVWYLDLFAGKNGYEAADKGGTGGHKEINRTSLTMSDIEQRLNKPKRSP